ncbi:UNVERIFIED_CONTAM: hypothetical protein FKN15_004776 [Acipenser sinensis]
MLQPLDVCVNKPFKEVVKKKYIKWMADAEHAYTPTGRIQKPSLSTLAEWILFAWNSTSAELIQKSFKKCSITNSLDGSEDLLLWEDENDSASEEEEEESGDEETDDLKKSHW